MYWCSVRYFLKNVSLIEFSLILFPRSYELNKQWMWGCECLEPEYLAATTDVAVLLFSLYQTGLFYSFPASNHSKGSTWRRHKEFRFLSGRWLAENGTCWGKRRCSLRWILIGWLSKRVQNLWYLPEDSVKPDDTSAKVLNDCT